jgi:hypothetical protein
MSRDGKTLDVTFAPPTRRPPQKTVLHVPPLAELSRVTVNGKVQTAKRKTIMLEN